MNEWWDNDAKSVVWFTFWTFVVLVITGLLFAYTV